MTTTRESRCSSLLAETKLAKIRFHANIKANRNRVTIGTLISRDLGYHGYETASRRISGFIFLGSGAARLITRRTILRDRMTWYSNHHLC